MNWGMDLVSPGPSAAAGPLDVAGGSRGGLGERDQGLGAQGGEAKRGRRGRA